jgi:GTP cyclohydrolase I
MAGHCTDTKEIQYLDNSSKMGDLDFKYDQEYYPEDSELPDPQQNPLIFGSKVVLQKVGIAPVDLPVKVVRRDGTIQELHAKVSLYGSLDNAEAKGLNLSRFYILMHDRVADHLSIDGLKDVLQDMSIKQGAKNAYCKMRFSYPWVQEALRTREELPNDAPDSDVFKVVDGVKLSHKKKMGHIFYECELEAQLCDGEYKFYLTVDYTYSSTCPCSFELAHDARIRRKKAANGHSQRSIATIKVQFDPDNIVWIEDVVELARKYIPTEVVVVCKRRDEQAFAELNGSNLLFTEDAARLLYQGLDEWFESGKISDFSIVTNHIESLHPWSAIAVVYKGVDGGLR